MSDEQPNKLQIYGVFSKEAIRLMNDSPFGLTASIWTGDVEAAERIGVEFVPLDDLFARADIMRDPFSRRNLQGYIFQTGQPAEVREAFLAAMKLWKWAKLEEAVMAEAETAKKKKKKGEVEALPADTPGVEVPF